MKFETRLSREACTDTVSCGAHVLFQRGQFQTSSCTLLDGQEDVYRVELNGRRSGSNLCWNLQHHEGLCNTREGNQKGMGAIHGRQNAGRSVRPCPAWHGRIRTKWFW